MLVDVEIPGPPPPKLVYAPSLGSGFSSSAPVSPGIKLKGKNIHGVIHTLTGIGDQRRNSGLL